jgi:hypothetical protein
MSIKENIEIDLERITTLQAQIDKFGDTLMGQSDKLIEYVETASVITKRLNVEIESLRGIKESLRHTVIAAVKDEIKASSLSLSNELFTGFSAKATELFNGHLSSINRANQNVKGALRTWSALTFKQISILVSSSVLIGISSFLICRFFTPSQRLTQDEMNYMYYGQAYAYYMGKAPPELRNAITVAANALKNTVKPMKNMVE